LYHTYKQTSYLSNRLAKSKYMLKLL